MFDFGGLGDLLGGASDIIQDPMASIEEVIPVDGMADAASGVTDAASGATDQVAEAGSGITDSISSLLP